MEKYNSQAVTSQQDLSHLLQRGRRLHDRAIYEFFAAMVAKVQLLFAKGERSWAQVDIPSGR